jgi:Zn-dependent protease
LATQEFMLMLPLWYVVFLLSITTHEAAHALVARLGGDETAYLGGQVSLNPLPHVQREPFGTILIPLLTFFMFQGGWMMGWASAPYDAAWEERHPERAAAMALAGPVANLGLAVIAMVALKVGLVTGLWEPLQTGFDNLVAPVSQENGIAEGLGRLLSVMFGLNLLLFLFNMIPMPPMDGAAVLAGVWKPARRFRAWLRQSPLGSMAGIVIAWYILPYVFWPLYLFAIGLLW